MDDESSEVGSIISELQCIKLKANAGVDLLMRWFAKVHKLTLSDDQGCGQCLNFPYHFTLHCFTMMH